MIENHYNKLDLNIARNELICMEYESLLCHRWCFIDLIVITFPPTLRRSEDAELERTGDSVEGYGSIKGSFYQVIKNHSMS